MEITELLELLSLTSVGIILAVAVNVMKSVGLSTLKNVNDATLVPGFVPDNEQVKPNPFCVLGAM